MCILRNKNLFSIVADAFGYSTAKNIGRMRNGKVELLNHQTILFTDVLKMHQHLFLKPLDTECGEGVFSVDVNEHSGLLVNGVGGGNMDIKKILEIVEKQSSEYLVQEKVIQHSELNRLYPLAINTLRITTVKSNTTGKIGVLHCLLRIGANGNIVDNWAKGGIVIGVKDDGFLNDYGFFKPGYGKRVSVHPDTGMEFSKFRVPFYKEAISDCLRFHADLNQIGSIGWDVAITEDGPLFIEGNDNWEISLHQTCGGLKNRFEELQR